MHPQTLAEINRRNREFWPAQTQVMMQRLADEPIRTMAFAIMDDAALRGVPAKFQKCLNAALEDAAFAQRHFTTALARKGGRTAKRDSLQQLIDQIVGHHPAITEGQLLAGLKSRQTVRDVIEDIDGQSIAFVHNGRIKAAPLSGLKDRLSRAKKQTGSR